MKLTPRSQTGNDFHDSRRRPKRPRRSPIKPESSPDAPYRFPSISMGSIQNDLVPPSGLHRLPRPPSLPNPLPPPPAGWQGEQMTEWLRAKAEEDRRKQAEEKTQQESLILEQRRIEQCMLADCLRVGMPPHFLPWVFAAFQHTAAAAQSAPTVPQMSSNMEFQQRSAATRAAQPQSQPQPQALAQSQPPPLPSLSAQAQQQSYQGPVSSMNPPPSQAQQPAQAPAQPVQQSPGFRQSFPIMGPVSHPPRSMELQGQSQSSGARHTTTAPPHFPPPNWAWDYRQPPPLAFHHWTPPESLQAQSQSQPQSQNPAIPTNDPGASPKPPASNLRSEQNSPVQKRKDERSHQKVPPPSSRVPDASTRRQYASDSSRGIWSQPHRRQISDVSNTQEARGNDEGESSEQFSEFTPAPTDLSSIHNTSDSARGASQSAQDVNVGSRNASSTCQ